MISGFAAGSFKQLAFLPPLHVLASGSFAVVRFFRGMKNEKTISFVRVASATLAPGWQTLLTNPC